MRITLIKATDQFTSFKHTPNKNRAENLSMTTTMRSITHSLDAYNLLLLLQLKPWLSLTIIKL